MTIYEIGAGFGITTSIAGWIFSVGYARGKFNYLEKQILLINGMKNDIEVIKNDVSWIKKELEEPA